MNTASINFTRFDHKKRFLAVEVQVPATGRDEAIAIVDQMESDFGLQFSGCPTIEENLRGKTEYYDSYIIPYDHGEMADIKKEIKKQFKDIKKALGLK